MNHAVQANFAAMEKFLKSPAGCRLAQEILLELQAIPTLSPLSSVLNLSASLQPRWPHLAKNSYVCRVTPGHFETTTIEAYPFALPFANQRFDLVFAPFLWELGGVEPRDLVHEIDRVLASMGQVVVLGFNPLGLWKLSRWFNFSKPKPWYHRSSGCSFWQVRRLFYQLDYEQVYVKFFYYLPPVGSLLGIQCFDYFHHFSQLIAFYPSSCYLLVMKKRDPAWISPVLVKNIL